MTKAVDAPLRQGNPGSNARHVAGAPSRSHHAALLLDASPCKIWKRLGISGLALVGILLSAAADPGRSALSWFRFVANSAAQQVLGIGLLPVTGINSRLRRQLAAEKLESCSVW